MDDDAVSFVPVSLRGSTVGILLLACIGLAALVGSGLAGGGGVVAPPHGAAPPGPGEEPPPPPPQAADSDSFAGSKVTVEATLLEPLFAPPRARGLAARADGTPLAASAVAGVGAGFDAAVDARGSALVSVDLGAGSLLRHLAVDPLEPRQVVVGARVQVRGALVDAKQQPVLDASVWFGELGADGRERTFEVDEDGAFSADVPAGDGVPFVARGPGYASTWRVIEVRAGVGELSEVLRPATTLHVQLAGRAVEIERARAFVVPVADAVSSSVAQWPFFAQLQRDGYAVDADGRVRIPGLPRDGQVGVVVRHPRSPIGPPVVVALSEEREQVVVPVSFGERVVSGAVVDERGEPVAGAWLFGRVRGRALDVGRSLRLQPPYLSSRGLFVARSDARGRFSLCVPDVPDAEVAVRAPGFAGRDLAASGGSERAIRLADWRGGDASLQVPAPPGDAPWRLSGGGVEFGCEPGAAGLLALPRCGRYRLRLALFVDGATATTTELSDVAVTGPVVLPALR